MGGKNGKSGKRGDNMRLNLVQVRNIIIAIALLVLAGEIGYWLGSNRVDVKNKNLSLKNLQNVEIPLDKKNVDFSLFWEVWNRLEESYLEEEDIDYEKMVYGAISGMTAALGDPYTVFLPPSDNKSSKEDLNGSFEGVGIQLGYKDGDNLVVVAPLKDLPADKAGVRSGDLILHIKDEQKDVDTDTMGMSLPEAVEIIRGLKGNIVTLTLLHEGEVEPYSVDLVRDTITVSSVEVEFGHLNDEGKWEKAEEGNIVAWLRLYRFGELTDDQWDEAVGEVLSKCGPQGSFGCKGIVLDVRNNPGGFLDAAINLAGEFLGNNLLVVRQENSDSSNQDYKVKRIGRLTKVPLVVLVNRGSASASEILAGALRDHGRAKIIGEKSFGKGTIQEAIDLREGSGLHVTVAKWLLPNGDWIHKNGIVPDIQVGYDESEEARDLQLERAAEELNK